jgi:hypothetical protein
MLNKLLLFAEFVPQMLWQHLFDFLAVVYIFSWQHPNRLLG